MKNKKFKLLFGGNILTNGLNKNCNRSGIYFTAFNIFKHLLANNNIELTIYTTSPIKYNALKKYLKLRFPNDKIKIADFSEIIDKSLADTLLYTCTIDKNIFYKLFLSTIINLGYCLYKKIYEIRIRFFSRKVYDAILSPLDVFPKFVDCLKIKNRYTILYDTVLSKFPHYYPIENTHWYKKIIRSLNENDNYFTDSECARQDFLEYKINPNKIKTVYLGSDFCCEKNQNDINRVKTKYKIPKDKKYSFSLCTLEPRKNLIRTVKTFVKFIEKNNIDDLVLVMGGGEWKSFKKVFDKETSNISTDKILHIGYVDDEDLPVLYSGAEWFTYTSEYEGFGLPVLEAMKCGCPVITSNNSSMPEVIGDAGIQINCYSDEQHIEAYEKYYYNDNLRKENSVKGLERAKMFTWENTVNKMLDIMTKK